MARDFRRQLDSFIDFAANQPKSFEIPTDSVYKEIMLLLQMKVSTGVAGAFDGFFDGSPWTNIKRIELIDGNGNNIKSYDGIALHDLNWFDFGIYSPTEEMTLGASTDTGTMHFGLIISLESVLMQLPQNTWLDSRKFSSIELRITFGAGMADLASSVAVTTLDTYRLTPFGQEILDVTEESKFSINKEILTTHAFPTNTATDKQFKLNVGNAFRAIVLGTRDSNNRSALASNDRFTKLVLKENGTFDRRTWDVAALKIHNAIRLIQGGGGLGLGEAPGIPNTPAGGPTSGLAGGLRSGLLYLDIAEDGAENSMLDTLGFSSLNLHADWTGANTTDLVRILTREYQPFVR